MLSLFRIIKFALQDIGRNLGLSFMTVFVLVLMLLSINILWSLETVTKQAVASVKKQVDISFYFTSDVSDKVVQDVKTFANTLSEVQEVKLLSKEEVLKDFKERNKSRKETLEALNELGYNPFGPTMIVRAKEPNDYNKIISALDVPEYKNLIKARSYDTHETAINRLHNITNRIEKIGLGLSSLFVIIAFLIIFSTIRVFIATQRAEISIKRLVGASNWFIRGPYLFEAVIFTALSVAATIFLIFFALNWFDPYLSIVLPDGFSLTNYYKSNILWLFGFQAADVLILTIISSGLAMRKQLKV